MKRPKDIEYAKWLAQYYLSYRMMTNQEVIDKLRKKEISENIIEECIEFLEKYKFINDYDYACRFINDGLKFKKQGERLIRQKLKFKGITDATLDKAFNEIEFDKTPVIMKIIEKKNLDISDYKKKQRLINYLAGRGYSFDDIQESIDEFTKQNNDY